MVLTSVRVLMTDECITCYAMEEILRNVKNTAPGCDSLPSWLFRSRSYELAEPIAHIYNCSLHYGVFPSPWRTAIVTPVPKICDKSMLQDLSVIYNPSL